MWVKWLSFLLILGVLTGSEGNYKDLLETAEGMDEVNLEELAELLHEQLFDFEEGLPIPPSPFVFDEECNEHAEFRSITGVCNNLNIPLIGSTNTPQTRFVPNRYDNGISTPTTNFRDEDGTPGNTLPSARAVTVAVHLTKPNISSDHSHFLMNWGQFLDHDMILTPFLEGLTNVPSECCLDPIPPPFDEECQPIPIPSYDPEFTEDCLPFKRSEPVPGFPFDPVERFQIDEVSSYVDASMVYGPNKANANSLRLFKHGLFKTEPRKDGQIGLPSDPGNPSDCTTVAPNPPQCTLLAGDVRVTEQAALSSMHTLLVREHNRIAKELLKLNVNWDDELIYQTARKIVGAIVQQISFREFLPIVLGPEIINKYSLNLLQTGFFDGYTDNLNTAISTEWGAAAFRFGHTLIRQTFQVKVGLQKDIGTIFDSFNTINNFGSNGLLNGLATDPVESLDRKITTGVRDRLFNEFNDLAALNIQRGRDHGIGSYNDFRKFFGLGTSSSYSFYTSVFGQAAAYDLESVYPSPNDIELFPGGLSEKALPNALMGPTLANVLGFQFKIIRFGDRFWYETDDPKTGFTAAQLYEIRKVITASLFCSNTDVQHQRKWIMRLEGDDNPVIDCAYIPQMDFTPWRDDLARYGREVKVEKYKK